MQSVFRLGMTRGRLIFPFFAKLFRFDAEATGRDDNGPRPLLGPGRLPLERLATLREAFAESDLPIRVDLVDWQALSENFRAIIAANCEVIQHAAPPAAVEPPQTAPRDDRRW